MLHRSLQQTARRATTTLAMITGLTTALAAGPATAATIDGPLGVTGINGQIVQTCVSSGHADIKAFTINGWNQNNNYVAGPKRDLPGDRNQTRCYVLDGWWWKGTIDVDFWSDSGAKLGTRQCYVSPDLIADMVTCTFN
ncbi:hypothetical protein ACFPOI_52105 [Nonomuraea angiospora]|uniref:Secreted protein n=1 Tax=Nonomuraea angiospora TaxID=46172 RepID=A0ABR9M5F2_9ACTN|nr:hypothetical protein [Nonomuraea angiospora]MBE1588141.1 hypothetical protein [Nonomuraea angiospora]